MDQESRRAVPQKVEQISPQLVHGQAGGVGAGEVGAGGAGVQRQLQGAQTEAPHHNLAGGGSRVMDAFVTTIGEG